MLCIWPLIVQHSLFREINQDVYRSVNCLQFSLASMSTFTAAVAESVSSALLNKLVGEDEDQKVADWQDACKQTRNADR